MPQNNVVIFFLSLAVEEGEEALKWEQTKAQEVQQQLEQEKTNAIRREMEEEEQREVWCGLEEMKKIFHSNIPYLIL